MSSDETPWVFKNRKYEVDFLCEFQQKQTEDVTRVELGWE